MKNRKDLAFTIVIGLLLLGLVGTSMAYMFKRTSEIKNQFEPAVVECAMVDGAVSIKNTGSIDAYLRVRLVVYWVNASGEIVDKPSPSLTVQLADGWVAGSDNTYYYEKPVAPGKTIALLKAGTELTPLQDDTDNTTQEIKVFGEAIQSQPKTAATNAWGVTISNGIITSAP